MVNVNRGNENYEECEVEGRGSRSKGVDKGVDAVDNVMRERKKRRYFP